MFLLDKRSITGILINMGMLILMFIMKGTTDKSWIILSSCLYCVVIILNIFILRDLNGSIFSFSIIYYGLACIFNLSQIYLGLIDSNSYYNIFNLFPFESCKKAFEFGYICIHIMIIAYYLFWTKYEILTLNLEIIDDKNDIKILNGLFYVLFTIKLVIRAFLLILAFRVGYLQALQTISESYIALLVMAADVTSIVYLTYCSQQKRSALVKLFVILEMIFMLSGSRIYGTTYIVLMVTTVMNRDTSKRKKLIIIIGGIIGLVFLEMIMDGRLSGNGYNLEYLKEGGIFFQICKEFGLTMLDTTVAINYNNNLESLNGLSYYGGIVTIIPNFSGIYTPILEKMQFMNQLNNYFMWSYGGSNVAECLMNFGYLGAMVFGVIGVMIRKIETSIKYYKHFDIKTQLVISAFAYEFIIWNRNCFYNCIRLPVWLFIIWLIVKSIFRSRRL